jgi:hypothetical protein
MHQAWPKFVARMHKSTPDGGVAVTLWGPATTVVPLPGGGNGTVSVATDYPFGDNATVTVTAPVGTPVWLRVPGWATAAVLCVAPGSSGVSGNPTGGSCAPIGSSNGSFVIRSQPAPVSTYEFAFYPSIRATPSFWNNSAAVYRGALLYALQIGENQTTIGHNAYNSTDFTVEVGFWTGLGVLERGTNIPARLTYLRVCLCCSQ